MTINSLFLSRCNDNIGSDDDGDDIGDNMKVMVVKKQLRILEEIWETTMRLKKNGKKREHVSVGHDRIDKHRKNLIHRIEIAFSNDLFGKLHKVNEIVFKIDHDRPALDHYYLAVFSADLSSSRQDKEKISDYLRARLRWRGVTIIRLQREPTLPSSFSFNTEDDQVEEEEDIEKVEHEILIGERNYVFRKENFVNEKAYEKFRNDIVNDRKLILE
ncbi:hypothetical protein Syun_001822 [Stephania yunnanensis]|uniref:Uncharacterized protein n=1 Tax=Stephania yunnanensis TaxID=152371 RepID=A0AAP0LGF3_9MAGN